MMKKQNAYLPITVLIAQGINYITIFTIDQKKRIASNGIQELVHYEKVANNNIKAVEVITRIKVK